MTSTSKIKANRANALASTGPKTSTGRARSRRNALRHGLSLSVFSDPILSDEVEALAREIAESNAGPQIQELARRVAAAQVDLRRVRYARHRLLRDAWKDSNVDREDPQMNAMVLEILVGLVSEPAKARHLIAIDRYERRALSRRKFAIREFDGAR